MNTVIFLISLLGQYHSSDSYSNPAIYDFERRNAEYHQQKEEADKIKAREKFDWDAKQNKQWAPQQKEKDKKLSSRAKEILPAIIGLATLIALVVFWRFLFRNNLTKE